MRPLFRPLLCLSFAVAAVAVARADETIRTAAALRAMPSADAANGHPVDLEVVVTFVDRSRGMLFVNDGSDGFYVKAHELVVKTEWLETGRHLRLRGVTHEGEFLPVVAASEFVDLGIGKLPAARLQHPPETLLAPAMDSQWVEIEGVVKLVGEQSAGIALYLEAGPLRLPLELPRAAHPRDVPESPVHLLERRVRLRCVAATLFNEQRQMSGRMLYLPSLEFLTVLDADDSVEDLPLRRVDELLLPASPVNERVRVHGIVTHAVPGQFLFLRGEGGSIRIDSALTGTLKPGTIVEVAGIVKFSPFRPSMSASFIDTVARGDDPEPVPLDLTAERRSAEQFEFVTLDTVLVGIIRTSKGARLLCRSGETVFEAKLSEELARFFKPEPESRIRLRGICELEIDNPFGIARFTKVFTIALRNSQDLVILAPPPYWNNHRLLMLLLATSALGLIFAIFTWILRRMVAEKSAIIESHTAARATLEERQRIARDLHDTLEQELGGVSMLIDATARQLDEGNAEARRSLDLARQLMRHSREESRSTIRDLRSVLLEKTGLAGAMETLLPPLANSAGLAFSFEKDLHIPQVPGTVETAFLRIAHEAVANAAQHSGGSRVDVRISSDGRQLTLDVRDDGTGFLPESAAGDAAGHFGLMGMRERAARIGAALHIARHPEGGTHVALVWKPPVVAASTSSPSAA